MNPICGMVLMALAVLLNIGAGVVNIALGSWGLAALGGLLAAGSVVAFSFHYSRWRGRRHRG